MKVAKFSLHGVVRTGIIADGVVHAVHQSLDELVAGAEPQFLPLSVPVCEVRLLAPLTAGCRGLLCAGINYVAHQEESADTFAAELPADPIFFFKTPSAVTGPDVPLPLDTAVSTQFDWEVELGVVIGRAGRDISREAAADHIFGYTIVNDITARDVQSRHRQWHLGKNVDRCTPVGPWVVTTEEIGYPPAADLSLTINGLLMQQGNTRDMIFGIADQIAIVSRYIALQPGDILATGTPAGVGFTRTPPQFLGDGDLVEASISGIGTVRNQIRASVSTPGGTLAGQVTA